MDPDIYIQWHFGILLILNYKMSVLLTFEYGDLLEQFYNSMTPTKEKKVTSF